MKDFNSVLYIYSNMDSKSQILLFLIILVALMLVSILIINYVTKKRNNKILLKDNTNKKISILKQKINDSNNDIKPLIDLKKTNKNKIEIKEKQKENDKIDIIENTELSNKSVQTEEKTDEVVKIVSKKTSLDDITKLIEDTLETGPIDLTKFEEDQEENAIISYDELVKRAGAKKIIYKCEEQTPILDVIDNEKITPENTIKQEINTSPRKFQASKVISPVFGVQKETEEKDDVLETFIDLEEFSFNENKDNKIESQSDMEFLTSLKEFRNGLD